MEGSRFAKEEVEELSIYSNEVICILTRNEEQFTENKNGYIFDVSKLKESTISELKQLTSKPISLKDNLSDRDENSSVDFSSTEVQMNKYPDSISNKSVLVSPKFLSEYNTDFQKLTAKPASMMKFLNAKKKYLRNSDNNTFTKIDLKRECYL